MASLNTILPNSIETEIHPVPLRYLELTPTRRVAYRKYEGYREPTILYIPGFFAPMDLRKTVAIEEYAIQNGYSNVRYDQECVGKSTGSQTTIGKKVSQKSDKEVMLNTGMTYTDNNTSINLVTCTIRTAEMTMANLTHISFSVIESQTFWSQTGVVEHEIWKFIFFHQKLCFCLIIIKIDLQIITQIVCTYILLIFHFLRSTSHSIHSTMFKCSTNIYLHKISVILREKSKHL